MKFNIVRLDVADSTMKAVRRLENPPSGTVLVAGEQTEGTGTMGRKWMSGRGGLYFTLVLRENYRAEILSHFSLLVASCVASHLRDAGISSASVLWPNDVLCGIGKVAGVMAEGEVAGDRVDPLHVGVGVNVSNDVSALRKAGVRATSLREETGRELQLDALLDGCLGQISSALEVVEDTEAVHKRISGTLASGMTVQLESTHGVFDALFTGVTREFMPVFTRNHDEIVMGRTEVKRLVPLRVSAPERN